MHLKLQNSGNENPDGITVVGFTSPDVSANYSPQQIRQRKLKALEGHRENLADFDVRSIATTSSASLDKSLGKMKIPLQWTNPKNGKQILLWKCIDNISKWMFPLSFVIFCTIYWIVLYIHSKIDDQLDYALVSSNLTAISA